MIKPKSAKSSQIEIDLTGPQGNAFCLLGMAQHFCRQMKVDPEPILDEMMSDDYENLVSVFDRHFGHFVTLYR